MKLVELSEKDKEQYNQFVSIQPLGSFLQSWDWGQWQEKLGRQVRRFFIKDEQGKIFGALEAVIMPLPLKRFFVYVPYGPVFDGKPETIINELFSKFPKAIFIRLEPKEMPNVTAPILNVIKSSNIQPAKTLVIDLSRTEEELLSDMHAKTRYNIRLAQKHGVEIQDEFVLTVGKGLFAQEAVELIYNTAKRQAYLAQARSYFQGLVDFFAVQNSKADLRLHIYKALYDKQLLASAIIIDFGGTRTYLFGGSSSEQRNLMAPYLLHWQAMLDAKAQGQKSYDFWGIETAKGEEPGFVRFKLGFGGQAFQYAGAYDCVNSRALYNVYKFLRVLNRFGQKLWKH